MLDLYKTKRKRPWKITYDDGREVLDTDTAAGLREYKARTRIMAERQDHYCAICRRSLHGFRPSFDHQGGRGAKGAWRDDRIEVDGQWHNAALCWPCNGNKGSKRYHWINDGGRMKYLPIPAAVSDSAVLMSTGDEA